MPDIDYTTIYDSYSLRERILNLSSITAVTPLRKCSDFEFASSDDAAISLTQEFGLICDHQSLLSVVEMCFLAGAAAGSFVSGGMSDRFGRKHTLMLFATIQTICGK